MRRFCLFFLIEEKHATHKAPSGYHPDTEEFTKEHLPKNLLGPQNHQ